MTEDQTPMPENTIKSNTAIKWALKNKLFITAVTMFLSIAGYFLAPYFNASMEECIKEHPNNGYLNCVWMKTDQLIQNTALDHIESPPGIAVFLPNPQLEGAFYRDGQIQKSGFIKGRDTYLSTHTRKVNLEFEYYVLDKDRKDGEPLLKNRLLQKMKHLYKENGIRIFILTMSSTASEIRSVFAEWRHTLNQEKPVLIFTVASAPGLVSRKDGIYRSYIRSREETEALASHAVNAGLHHVGIFFITRTLGANDEFYGEKTRELFAKLFLLEAGETSDWDVIQSGNNASAQVKKFLKKHNHKKSGAFVVGYGKMFQRTLQALIDEKFQGNILTVSTYSESSWRPKTSQDTHSDIHFTYPYLRTTDHSTNHRGVVQLFSQNTLLKALNFAAESNSIEEFETSWYNKQCYILNNGPEEDCLINGDSLVHIKVRRAEQDSQ
ncbi:MAG: hypothetical protein HQL69_24085 [Magnetococcales bacterium]|nr:hypothetical protein [Magnetococcales bacterium]